MIFERLLDDEFDIRYKQYLYSHADNFYDYALKDLSKSLKDGYSYAPVTKIAKHYFHPNELANDMISNPAENKVLVCKKKGIMPIHEYEYQAALRDNEINQKVEEIFDKNKDFYLKYYTNFLYAHAAVSEKTTIELMEKRHKELEKHLPVGAKLETIEPMFTKDFEKEIITG